jgi:hypothetical protein
MKKETPLLVKEDPSVGPEVLASAIVEVSKAAKKLLASRLSEEAILVLLKHQTRIPMEQIRRVLHAAVDLERTYLK